jgi:tRNA (adenine57-N1/adenine58-N1)-methyltransferase catalytic subunit
LSKYLSNTSSNSPASGSQWFRDRNPQSQPAPTAPESTASLETRDSDHNDVVQGNIGTPDACIAEEPAEELVDGNAFGEGSAGKSLAAERPAEGDLALLVAPGEKRYLLRLRAGGQLHTHLGIYRHDDLIGQLFGTLTYSQLNHPALLLQPALRDLMTHIKRGTQIIYPKDAAYLTYRLNLRAGTRVIEAGTGSGSLTIALAWAVAPLGRVYTYEVRPEVGSLARANLQRAQLDDFVTFHEQSIDEGFVETGVDALFLDVREPWRFLRHVPRALKPGGYFAGLVPTTNQVSDLIEGLEQTGFVEISVEELLLRTYKPIPERLRPNDMMIGHTGFLVFARSTQMDGKDGMRWQSKERRRFLARRKMNERDAAEAARAEDADENDGNGSGRRKYPRLPLPD